MQLLFCIKAIVTMLLPLFQEEFRAVGELSEMTSLRIIGVFFQGNLCQN